jgi:hypothetical protein
MNNQNGEVPKPLTGWGPGKDWSCSFPPGSDPGLGQCQMNINICDLLRAHKMAR